MVSGSMSTDELVDLFRRLPTSEKERASELPGVRYRSLYGLKLAHVVGADRATALELHEALDAIGVSLSSEQIRKVFGACEGLVSVRPGRRAATYRLMQDGYKELDKIGSGVAVVRIVEGKPLIARERLADLLGAMQGVVRISDPFYGRKTVSMLAEIQKAAEVRFLTSKCGGGESQNAVIGALRDLMKEQPILSIRVASNGHSLSHDRFALTDDSLVLIGHGMKDLGNRDSFIIRLPTQYVSGIATETLKQFDRIWALATAM